MYIQPWISLSDVNTVRGGYLLAWQDVGTLAGHTVDELREISHHKSVYTMVYIYICQRLHNVCNVLRGGLGCIQTA